MKKMLITIIVAVLLSGALYAAGSDETEAAAVDAVTVHPSGFPIVNQPVTINILTKQLPYMTDMKSNEFIAWYEEKTNVHVDLETVPRQGAKEKRNLILASGDLPEVFLAMDIKPDIEMQYRDTGYFRPLNDLLRSYGPNIDAIFNERPHYRKTVTNPDGNIYSLPGISENLGNSLKYKCYINTKWLDTLGLEMPTTTEEFYEVLKAFKTQDPNGNGKQDEIPLSASYEVKSESVPQMWLLAPFVLNDPTTHLYVENDRVKLSARQPEYREGLRWLNRLYEEDLLDKESFTQTRDQLEQLARRDGDELLGSAPIKSYNHLVALDSERADYYRFVPPLEGPSGARHVWYKDSPLMLGRYTITKECDLPEVAMRWADWMYSEEGTLLSFYSYREGVHWVNAAPGAVAGGGGQATWDRPEDYSPPELYSTCLGNVGLFNLTEELKNKWAIDPDNVLIPRLGASNEVYLEAALEDTQRILPDMYLSEEDSSILAMNQTNLNNYIDETFARFVTGAMDIDSQWDSYVKSLERFGANEVVEVYQRTYDAFNRM